jgi:release factor glutamine methyltransferase
MARLKNLMDCARNRLAETTGCDMNDARADIRALMCHALDNASHAWLIAHQDDDVSPELRMTFEALLSRRIHGEPVAYIIGKREFYGLELRVTPDTLIPRPDTETLVETALNRIPQGTPCQVLDLGTGTGAIALAIAKNRPLANVTAIDQSSAALAIAQGNAATLNIANIQCMQSNWFSALAGQKFDMIVSNPPYIEAGDPHLQQGDLRFEPHVALASGADGLDDIRIIIHHAPQHLQPAGWLMLEHGYLQAEAIRTILQQYSFGNIHTTQDIAGRDRVTFGQIAA